jgi:deazaflavin-dependent oxidoreductase (nitroreductase family)
MLNHQFGLDPPSPIPSALGRRGPALIRFFARVFNPVVLAIAGRRWMPVFGILYHRGRRTARDYTTPVAMRRDGDDFFVPLTLGDKSHWYRNVNAAGGASVMYRGVTEFVGSPHVVDLSDAAYAFPRYERVLFRIIGITYFLKVTTPNELQ